MPERMQDVLRYAAKPPIKLKRHLTSKLVVPFAFYKVLQGNILHLFAVRARFELAERETPFVSLANWWIQPLSHLTGSLS